MTVTGKRLKLNALFMGHGKTVATFEQMCLSSSFSSSSLEHRTVTLFFSLFQSIEQSFNKKSWGREEKNPDLYASCQDDDDGHCLVVPHKKMMGFF